MNTPYSEPSYNEAKREPDVHSLAAVVREIRMGFSNLVKSDLVLVRTEMQDTASRFKKGVIPLAIFAGVALLGVLPFMAFLVIGFGEIIGSFWLSALVVSVVFFIVGGAGAVSAIAALKKQDMSFPHTRRALDHEISVVDRKLNNLVELSKGHLATATNRLKTEAVDLKESAKAGRAA